MSSNVLDTMLLLGTMPRCHRFFCGVRKHPRVSVINPTTVVLRGGSAIYRVNSLEAFIEIRTPVCQRLRGTLTLSQPRVERSVPFARRDRWSGALRLVFLPAPHRLLCLLPCRPQVLPLKHRSEVNGPFPIADEPSDHVLLAADYKMNRPVADDA